MLCVVDDAHWLDDASAEASAVRGRRVQADPVALMFSVRDGDRGASQHDGVPSLNPQGLDEAAARAVLAERAGGPLPEASAGGFWSWPAGNPLALVELPGGLSVAQLTGCGAAAVAASR